MRSSRNALLMLLVVLVAGGAWLYVRASREVAPHETPSLRARVDDAPARAASESRSAAVSEPTLEPGPLAPPPSSATREQVDSLDTPAPTPARYRVRLVVLGPDGRPFRGAATIVCNELPRPLARRASEPGPTVAWSAASDEVALELRGARWSFRARALALESTSLESDVPAPVDAPLRLQLSATCAWRGIVRMPNGDPAADARVALARGEYVLASSRTDAAGRFELEGLPTGALRIEIGDAARVLATVTPLPIATGDVELEPITLRAPCELALEIDRTGIESADVRVLLQTIEGAQSTHDFRAGEPLRIRYVSVGRYRVHVWAGDRRGNRDVELRTDARDPSAPVTATASIPLHRKP